MNRTLPISESRTRKNPPIAPSQKSKPAWQFIPILEFINGFIHDVAGSFLTFVFKTFGASNQLISIGWLLQAPLTFKALWAPAVERWGTHRQNLLRSMLFSGLCIFILSAVFFFFGNESFLLISSIFFVMLIIMSFVEISVKGYKVSALNSDQIAVYSGISTACYRLGLMVGSSFLVYMVGWLEAYYRQPGLEEPQIASYATAWSIIFAGAGCITMAFIVYLHFILPYPSIDKGVTTKLTPQKYANIFLDYIRQNGGLLILTFLFLSRFGEGAFKVMWTPFSMDPVESGGVGVDLKVLGAMAPFSLSALVIGGIVGGLIVKFIGLKKAMYTLFPLMFTPNLIYSYIAYTQPTELINLSGFELHPWLLVGGFVELFAYAMAYAPIVVMIDLIAKNSGDNKATFGAISGSVLLLGFVAGGGVSGFIQAQIGYFWLFNFTFIISIPAYFLVFKLPLQEIEDTSHNIDYEAGMDANSA